MASSKVLITGGAGFIGLHLAEHLKEKGHELVIVDNLFRGKLDKAMLTLLSENGVKFSRIDLTKAASLDSLDRDINQVVHLAAINGTRFFYEIPNEVLRVNLMTLINVLNWVVDTDCKKFLFASSSETYAGTVNRNGCPIPTPEDVLIIVSDLRNPRYSYAISKIAGEALCLNYARVYGLKWVIPRYHNVYGPRMGEEHVIPQFIIRLLRRDNPFMVQGGNQTRAFCYVDDAVRATYGLMFSGACDNEIVNVGTQDEISIIDLAKKLFDISGFYPEVKAIPVPVGSVVRRCPDISKISQRLQWRPSVTLEEGLRRTYTCYAENYRT